MDDKNSYAGSTDGFPSHKQVVLTGGGALVIGLGTPILESSTAHRQIKWKLIIIE
jgi:hypothetical protein